MIFSASLWFHIIGITLMAGATVVEFMLNRKFWTIYAVDRQGGILVRKASDKLPILIIAGIVLILLSGVGMMAATHGIFDTMLWFRIKMILVFLVIVNGVANGRRLGAQLNRLLAFSPLESADQQLLNRVRSRLNLFYISQMSLFFIIFFLSAFKFN